MSKPKRFRDMSLTEDEVETLIHANADLCERKMSWSVDPFGVGEELDNTELVVFIDRAKRLLPLWRKRGIENAKPAMYTYGVDYDMEGAWTKSCELCGVGLVRKGVCTHCKGAPR